MKDTENKMYYDKYLKYKYKYNILRGGENPSFTNLDLNFTYGTLLAISGYVFESLDTSKRGEFTLNKNNLKVIGILWKMGGSPAQIVNSNVVK